MSDNIFRHIKMSKDLKAYEQPNDPPFLGDIRPTKDYPAGTLWGSITYFEVWDGQNWRDPNEPLMVRYSDPQDPTNFNPSPSGFSIVLKKKDQ